MGTVNFTEKTHPHRPTEFRSSLEHAMQVLLLQLSFGDTFQVRLDRCCYGVVPATDSVLLFRLRYGYVRAWLAGRLLRYQCEPDTA